MTLQEIKDKGNVTVPEAATIMRVSPQFLRAALIQEKFPFGVAVKMVQNEFYINAERFVLYMEGTDLEKQKEGA